MKKPRFGIDIPYSLDPSAAATRDCDNMSRAVRHALSGFRLTSVERDELMTLMGFKGATERLVASNTRLRLESTRVLVELLGKHLKEDAPAPGRRYFHISFLGPLINEYRPELDIDAYRQVVDRLLRRYPLSGVFSIELQALTNYPQKQCGRSFLVNAHAVAWTDDAGFDSDAAAKAMCESSALRCEFNTESVRSTSREDHSEVPYLGYYLTKIPAGGKRRGKDPDNKVVWKLFYVSKPRPSLLLRLSEMVSSLEVTDLVWGFNDGTDIRSKWKAGIRRWNDQRCRRQAAPLDRDFDVRELWQRIRSRPRNGSRNYRPPVYYGPRPRPIATEALPREAGKRIWPHQYDVWFDIPTEPPSGDTKLDDLDGIWTAVDTTYDDSLETEPKAIQRLKRLEKERQARSS